MNISKYLFLFGSLYLFSPIDAQQEPGEDLRFKVNKYYSSSLFNLLVKSKSCDDEVTSNLFYRKKGIEQALLKTIRNRGGIEIEAIISTQPKDDLQTQMICVDDNNGNKNYIVQMQAICTAPEFDNERCDEIFVDTDTNDFANLLNDELENIEKPEDDKSFLENIITASLEKTEDSDFLEATRCNRKQDVCFAGKADKTCCGFPGCECEKTSLTFCQFLCKYNIADCSDSCQRKYYDDKFGNHLCDNVDVGTTACLQPRRGVFLDGFITPVLELGDLVLNEPSNEEECKVELYKNSPTYEGFTYIIDANTNIKTCHFYRKEQLKTPGWLRFVASNVLNTDYMNAISFLDDSTNSPSNSPSASPTVSPSNQPSTNPTQNPTENPTVGPSKEPTKTPNRDPTTNKPSPSPTRNPSSKPTKKPSRQPTNNPVGNFLCGISLEDASLCNDNDKCPSGSDSECAFGQSCYKVEVYKNHFCGVSLDDASQCNDNDVCPSGSDSDCILGQKCYGVEVCKNHFCGISLDDASQCNDNDACPSGSDSDCILGQKCYGVEVCKNHFCGVSLDDASQCKDKDACPSGSDSDCSLGQSCYGVEVCNNNFCGVSLDDASQCNDKDACPSGSDSACALGQSCLKVNKCTPINCASTKSGKAKTTKSGKCKKSKGSKSGKIKKDKSGNSKNVKSSKIPTSESKDKKSKSGKDKKTKKDNEKETKNKKDNDVGGKGKGKGTKSIRNLI